MSKVILSKDVCSRKTNDIIVPNKKVIEDCLKELKEKYHHTYKDGKLIIQSLI